MYCIHQCFFHIFDQGGSSVQSGRQQSYTSWQPTTPRVTWPPWQPQSGGYTSGTISGSGDQQLTSSGSGGGQRQVGTPFDSGWQSQSLWEEAMSKGNTSSSYSVCICTSFMLGHSHFFM